MSNRVLIIRSRDVMLPGFVVNWLPTQTLSYTTDASASPSSFAPETSLVSPVFSS